jgi:hypothetical protein
MSESKEHGYQPEVAKDQSSIDMVEVSRISTVFEDEKVLIEIADELLKRGIISGYEITPVTSGYVYEGKEVKNEEQFRLEILSDDPSRTEEIKKLIDAKIGANWDVPKITEERVSVNKDMLGFIKNVEKEHKRFLQQKKWTRAVALTALLSIGGTLSSFTKMYLDNFRERAVAAERTESYKRILDLEKAVQDKIIEIEEKEREGKELTKIPPVEFGVETYEETREILKITREAEFEMRRLLEQSNIAGSEKD